MGRIEERRERNKKLITDVDNLIFDMNRTWKIDIKDGMPDDEEHRQGFYTYVSTRFQAMLLNRSWCWVDLSTVLNLIRNKAIDLGKSSEFNELYNEYKPEDEKEATGSFGKWDFMYIFAFVSHLIIDFQEVIQAIVKEHLNEEKDNGKVDNQ